MVDAIESAVSSYFAALGRPKPPDEIHLAREILEEAAHLKTDNECAKLFLALSERDQAIFATPMGYFVAIAVIRRVVTPPVRTYLRGLGQSRSDAKTEAARTNAQRPRTRLPCVTGVTPEGHRRSRCPECRRAGRRAKA